MATKGNTNPKSRYTAQDFFDVVEESARRNAELTIKTGVRTVSDVSQHIDETATKIGRHVIKTGVRTVSEINDHADENATKLADHATKTAAAAVADINAHTDQSIQTVGQRFDEVNRSIAAATRRIVRSVMCEIVPLWYSILAFIIAVVTGLWTWFVKIKPLTVGTPVKAIIRDEAGNAIDTAKVAVEATSTMDPFVGKCLAVGLAVIVLGVLFAIGATVYSAVLRHRADDNDNDDE